MNARFLLALLLCATAAAAAPQGDDVHAAERAFGPQGNVIPSDLTLSQDFASRLADFNDVDSNYDQALRVFPASSGGYWLVGRHAGNTALFPPFPTLVVAKFLGGGTFDSSYNGTGQKAIATPLSRIVDVAQGPGETLYALGTYTLPGFSDSDFGVYCVDSDGDPCADFGIDGLKSVALDLGTGDDRHNDGPARIIYAYGNLYLAGSADTGSGAAADYAAVVVKMSSASGSVDSGFGNVPGRPGVFAHNFTFASNGSDEIADLIAYSPAPFAVRVIVVGTTQRGTAGGEDTDGFVGAIDGISGQADALFDADGFDVIAIDLGTDMKDRLERVIRRANGGFVVAGTARDASASPAQYQLVLGAYDADGSRDAAFGSAGISHALVLSGTNRPFGLAERPQNRDIVVGIDILDDLFGDGHPLQAAVQYGASGHALHATMTFDAAGTPPATHGSDMVLVNGGIMIAGQRQFSSTTTDWDMTIARYIATDSLFADPFGGPDSD